MNYSIVDLMDRLPHRYPMLLIDKMLEINEDGSAKALKNVTINEPFFQGHFPGHPIMPGVLILESMAQAAGMMVLSSLSDVNRKDSVVYFMSIKEAHFRTPVSPGDTMILHVKTLHNRGKVWKVKGEATVDGKKVADAIFSAMIVKKK